MTLHNTIQLAFTDISARFGTSIFEQKKFGMARALHISSDKMSNLICLEVLGGLVTDAIWHSSTLEFYYWFEIKRCRHKTLMQGVISKGSLKLLPSGSEGDVVIIERLI